MKTTAIDLRPTKVAEVGSNTLRVFDGRVAEEEIYDFFTFINSLSYYRQTFTNETGHRGNRFITQFSPAAFLTGTEVGMTAKELVEGTYGTAAELLEVTVLLNGYGDLTFPEYGTPSSSGHVTLMYFCNLKWDYTWGGEVLFYEAKDTRSIVIPRPGRFLLFNNTLEFSNTAPTRVCKVAKYVIKCTFKLYDHAADQ